MSRAVAFCSMLVLALGCGSEPEPAEPDPLAEGWRAARAGDHEGAATHYARAADARPDDVAAWLGSAREALRAGRSDEARVAAARAVEIAPDSADAHELLGRALLAATNADGDAPTEEEAGTDPTAAAELARALELAPARSRLHFPLARAHERAGDRDAAIAAYRAAAEAGEQPARSLAAAVRTRLDALGPQTRFAMPGPPPSEAILVEIEQELDRAEALAGDDAAALGAIRGLRRRIAQKRALRAPSRAAPNQADRDMQIARNAGLLGALSGGSLNSMLGSSDGLAAGILGAQGAGLGAREGFGGLGVRGQGGSGGPGGFGSRGTGRGGGGTAEGLGGLGTLGRLPQPAGTEPVDRGRAELGEIRVTGALPADQVRRVVSGTRNAVQFCYQSERVRNPELSGELTVAFEVQPDGRVGNTRVAASSVGGGVGDCAARVMRRARFAAASGTTSVQVPYTFR